MFFFSSSPKKKLKYIYSLLRWFLKPCLFPALSSVNESAQVAAMSYTSLMLEVLHETAPDSPIIALLTRYMLGLSVDIETDGGGGGGGGGGGEEGKSLPLRDKVKKPCTY